MAAGRLRGSRGAAAGGRGGYIPAWRRRPAGSCGPAAGEEETGTWTEDQADSTERDRNEGKDESNTVTGRDVFLKLYQILSLFHPNILFMQLELEKQSHQSLTT